MADVALGPATTVLLRAAPRIPGARGGAGRPRFALVVLGPDGEAEDGWRDGEPITAEAAAALLGDATWRQGDAGPASDSGLAPWAAVTPPLHLAPRLQTHQEPG